MLLPIQWFPAKVFGDIYSLLNFSKISSHFNRKLERPLGEASSAIGGFGLRGNFYRHAQLLTADR